MKPAINPLYTYVRNQSASICPVGQADQAEINSMKLGNVLRGSNRRELTRPNFNTVWTSPVYATA